MGYKAGKKAVVVVQMDSDHLMYAIANAAATDIGLEGRFIWKINLRMVDEQMTAEVVFEQNSMAPELNWRNN